MGLSYPPEQQHGTSTTKVGVSLAWRKEVYAIMFHWSVQLAESAVTIYGLYSIASLIPIQIRCVWEWDYVYTVWSSSQQSWTIQTS